LDILRGVVLERSVYGALALTRAAELRARLAFAVPIAAVACLFTRDATPFVWYVLAAAAQLFDHWVGAPFRAAPTEELTPRLRLAYRSSMALSATAYSSLGIYLWFVGGPAGQVFGSVLPAGAVLHMTLNVERSQRAWLAGWVPHAVVLVATPVIFASISPALDLLVFGGASLGCVIYLLNALKSVRKLQRTAFALQAANEEADRLRAAAEEASVAKTAFLATLSHEIRTPLNGIVAVGTLLRRTELSPEQSEHATILEDSTEILMGVLNDVLDLAKIESGKLAIDPVDFDLRGKLEAAARVWAQRAEQKAIAVTADLAGLPGWVRSDPLRVQQIVFNLLSNAVKFTDEGEVRLAAGRMDHDGRPFLWIEVADSGCGMDAETAERVFAGFEQASAGVARTHGGTGLGLAISRRLADLLGGSLTVKSELGVGSTFRLEIPFEAAQAPVEEADPCDEDVHAPALRILVADDHEVNLRVLRLLLEPMGHDLVMVANGQEAVEAARREPFDVILLDMQMPVMGGVEAAGLIGKARLNAATPMIALTANAMQHHRDEWAAVGVTTFVTKPINVAELLGAVAEAVSDRLGDVPAASKGLAGR
jgi:signal transduction histidine kinase/CheY-like chemotaxis protein